MMAESDSDPTGLSMEVDVLVVKQNEATNKCVNRSFLTF